MASSTSNEKKITNKRRSCQCVNVEFGTYENTVLMWTWWKYKNGKPKISNIDLCIATEIQTLWNLKIATVESCCGHGKQVGYIAAYDDKSAAAMLELGYKPYPDKEDTFYPWGQGEETIMAEFNSRRDYEITTEALARVLKRIKYRHPAVEPAKEYLVKESGSVVTIYYMDMGEQKVRSTMSRDVFDSLANNEMGDGKPADTW